MTLAELKAAVKVNLGGRSDLDSLLPTYINWALYDVWKGYTWPQWMSTHSFTTTADTAEYDKPDGLIVDVVRRSSDSSTAWGTKLVRLPPRYFDRILPSPNLFSSGKPTHYVEWGSKITLWRTPDDEYSIIVRYQKEPTTLSNDSDSTEFSIFDPIVVTFATHHAFAAINEPNLMAIWYRRGKGMMDDLWKKIGYVPDMVTHRGANWPYTQYWADPFYKG